VLGCTYPGGEGTRIDAPGPLAMLQAMQTGDLDVAMRAAFAANHSPAYVADETNYEPFTRRALAVRIPVPTIMRQAQASAGHNASGRLGSITAPTLVIHGTADDMIRYSNGELVAKLIPGATLHTFPDVGHLFWWERPDETLRLVTEHVQSVGT
jgi:3-oxoadipate enol-lactonase